MADPLRPASTVAELITALSQYHRDARVGVAVTSQEGITVSVVPHQVVAVDCSLGPDADVRQVWVVAELAEEAEEPPGVHWACPRCGASTYLRDGDEVPSCCP